MKPLKSQNYYEILGVPRGAKPEDVRSAYELSRHTFQENSLATYSLFTEEENQELLALISRAYETLFNPELRREYDEFLDNLEPHPAAPRPTPTPGMPQPKQEPMRLDGNASGLRLRPTPARGLQNPTKITPVRDASRPTTNNPPGAANPRSEAVSGAPPNEAAHSPEYIPDVRPNEEQVHRYTVSLEHYSGPALRKVRQMRGYSVEDIAERTKIRKTYIDYLETEQFTFLPAPVYIKGFVVLIAEMLGLPSQEAADSYMAYYRANGAL